MRKVSLDETRAGSIIARTIFSLNGMVLLSAGSELTLERIRLLVHHGITEVYINDDISKDITIPETVREEILIQTKSQLKKLMTVPSIKTVDGEKALELVDRLMEEILKNDQIIISLSDIRSIDDYTFSHSVNVAIFSMMTGITLEYKSDDLRNLGVGALLHDIGKMRISDDVLKKPSSLTIDEYNEVKKHTVFGYEILKNSRNINTTAQLVALYHHERIDGSGYPYNLKGNEIPLPAKIVAVSDVFDALTTDRVYRHKMHPSKVVDYMYSLSNKHFDKTVLNAFFMHIANYPVGTGVLLNTGEKGLVSKYNPVWPNRPVVRILMNEKGMMLRQYSEMDLSRNPEYYIVDIWDV